MKKRHEKDKSTFSFKNSLCLQKGWLMNQDIWLKLSLSIVKQWKIYKLTTFKLFSFINKGFQWASNLTPSKYELLFWKSFFLYFRNAVPE